MKIDLDDEHLSFVINGLECLFQRYGDFGYKIEDAIKIGKMHEGLEDAVRKIISKAEGRDQPETLARNPEPGERTVLGKADYVKTTK